MRIEMNENDDDILGNVIITDDNGRELGRLPVLEDGRFNLGDNNVSEVFRNLPEMSYVNLYIPETVESIDGFNSENLLKIKEFQVSKDSNYFSTKDGVLYDKSEERLLLFPKAKSGEVSIPETVTVLNMYDFEGCKNLETINIMGSNTFLLNRFKPVDFHSSKTIVKNNNKGFTFKVEVLNSIVPVNKINVVEESSLYKSIDGVVYSKDYSRVIALPGKKTGTLRLPEGIVIAPDMSENVKFDSINIPASLLSIDFHTYRQLREINISKDHGLYASKDGIVYSKDMSTLLLCPLGKTGDVIIPKGVKRIASESFEYSSLKSLDIPATVRTIDSGAFEHVDFPIHVHEENPVYESRGGKLFYKNGKELFNVMPI